MRQHLGEQQHDGADGGEQQNGGIDHGRLHGGDKAAASFQLLGQPFQCPGQIAPRLTRANQAASFRPLILGGDIRESALDNLSNNHLLTNNPNDTNAANGAGAANPFRLDRSQAATSDQNHAYQNEQEAYDAGKMDLFCKYTGTASAGGVGAFGTTGQVMGYYDGNTVTAMWNYAQNYAMSDNDWTDTYGPSTPGALGVVSGQTNGAVPVLGTSSSEMPDGQGGYTQHGDVDPAYDSCSSTSTTVKMSGQNIGDLLNAANITWGGFMGGFDLGLANADGTTGCGRSTVSTTVNETVADYVPHHNWFQYYASTANYTHARPAAINDIGFSLHRHHHHLR